jgi:hypothetical protein
MFDSVFPNIVIVDRRHLLGRQSTSIILDTVTAVTGRYQWGLELATSCLRIWRRFIGKHGLITSVPARYRIFDFDCVLGKERILPQHPQSSWKACTYLQVPDINISRKPGVEDVVASCVIHAREEGFVRI